MRRWGIGLLIVLLSCVPIFLKRPGGPELLRDTDTRVLLSAIRHKDSPLSWFGTDWPLRNHFYRPVSTLVFELDNRLYGDDPAGYGLTNALLCIASVGLLFWFVIELTTNVVIATASGVLFALWNAGGAAWLGAATAWSSWSLLLLMLLPARRPGPAIVAWLGAWFLANELVGLRDLEHKVLDWIPGRTASCMTVFVLLALAAYCRYERLSATRIPPPDPGPLDPPATKGTSPLAAPSPWSWIWGIIALIATALALCSYEQAVMAPSLLLACGIFLRLSRLKVRWGPHVLCWALLVGYVALRGSIIGWHTSAYEEQQFRSAGMGVIFAIADYALPAFNSVWLFLPTLDAGALLFLTAQPYFVLLGAASNIGALLVAARRWRLVFLGWSLSILAFLPMAWLNPSDFYHYHYLPMAMRALFVVGFAQALGTQIVSAASRPAIQAPARLDPAPGSLPRP